MLTCGTAPASAQGPVNPCAADKVQGGIGSAMDEYPLAPRPSKFSIFEESCVIMPIPGIRRGERRTSTRSHGAHPRPNSIPSKSGASGMRAMAGTPTKNMTNLRRVQRNYADSWDGMGQRRSPGSSLRSCQFERRVPPQVVRTHVLT